MLTVAEHTMQKVLVRSVKGIERCTFVPSEQKKEEAKLIIQGINFDAFYTCEDNRKVTVAPVAKKMSVLTGKPRDHPMLKI